MRTPLLAGLLAVLLPACLDNSITGVGDGTGDGDGSGDGSGGSGDGSGSNNNGTPNLVAMLDKTTLVTENGKTELVTLTLTSEGGFSGDIALTPSLLDSANATIAAIQLAGPTTVSLAAGATQTAQYSIDIPSNTTGTVINGAQFKVALASSLGATDVTSAVTINNFYTVDYANGTGTTQANHMNAGMAVTIKRGTILKLINNDTIDHVIHAPNHEADAGGDPGRTYEVPTAPLQPGANFNVGCHSHGNLSYGDYTLD